MRKIFILLFSILILFSCKDDRDGGCNYDDQSINGLQYLGSHNSYRIKTHQPIFDFALNLYNTGALPDGINPQEWDYDQVSLVEQLTDYNLRTFEIDVFYDPDGGLYSERRGNLLVGENTASNIPALDEPGYKVIHIPDLDYKTHHYTFIDALETMKTWSDENKDHEPIFIMVELKDEAAGDYISGFGFSEAIPYSVQAMNELDQEIKEVFGADLSKIITPDELRGNYSTVEAAVLGGNWPTLRETKGKFFFVFMGSDDTATYYTENHPNLENRPMFYFTDPGNPNCAFVKYDNPEADLQNIKDAVNLGYMVRTRADAGTWEARSGNTSRREAAFASGAQIISTDYYKPDSRYETSDEWTNYSVSFPNQSAIVVNTVNNDFSCPE